MTTHISAANLGVSDASLRMKWWRSGEKLNNLYVEWTTMRKTEEPIS